VAFIQCVGSREPDHPYCSRLCCTHSVESAIKVKEGNPEAHVYILYRDIRTYGVREDLYRKARGWACSSCATIWTTAPGGGQAAIR
jgi:heterodisulfide reductase subunit A